MHFVEEVALAPPEVAIDQQLVLKNEQELAAAANAPLPDMEEDDPGLG